MAKYVELPEGKDSVKAHDEARVIVGPPKAHDCRQLEFTEFQEKAREYYKLCVWMIKVYKANHAGTELFSNQGQALDGISALANYDGLARQMKELQDE